MSEMSLTAADLRLRALARLACGRIAGSARAVLEAYELGVVEGPHEFPWDPRFHRDAVPVYAAALPPSYQLRVEEFFRLSSEAMANETIPGRLSEDWTIVRTYMDSLSSALAAYYEIPQTEPQEASVTPSGETGVGELVPMVVRFDLLARLTTSQGARRLERAAVTARDHMADSPPDLDDVELQILVRLNAGTPIVDIAAELGFSERSMYRSLARIWNKLGVSGRDQGIRRAVEGGLLGDC